LYLLWVGAFFFGAGIFFIVMNYLDVDFVEYVLNRTVNYEGSLVGDRINLFDRFFREISFFGSGLGRFGHGAVAEGYLGLPDSDYVRVAAELGIVGLVILLAICLYTLFCGLKIFRYAFFEVSTLCFCLTAMIGAAVWELGTLQPFLYWFCIGHIQSKFDRREELETEYAAYFEKMRKENSDKEDEEEE
jgi:hypothetical protein